MPLGVLLVKVLYKLRFFFHEFLIESVISVPFGALIDKCHVGDFIIHSSVGFNSKLEAASFIWRYYFQITKSKIISI